MLTRLQQGFPGSFLVWYEGHKTEAVLSCTVPDSELQWYMVQVLSKYKTIAGDSFQLNVTVYFPINSTPGIPRDHDNQ